MATRHVCSKALSGLLLCLLLSACYCLFVSCFRSCLFRVDAALSLRLPVLQGFQPPSLSYASFAAHGSHELLLFAGITTNAVVFSNDVYRLHFSTNIDNSEALDPSACAWTKLTTSG